MLFSVCFSVVCSGFFFPFVTLFPFFFVSVSFLGCFQTWLRLCYTRPLWKTKDIIISYEIENPLYISKKKRATKKNISLSKTSSSPTKIMSSSHFSSHLFLLFFRLYPLFLLISFSSGVCWFSHSLCVFHLFSVFFPLLRFNVFIGVIFFSFSVSFSSSSLTLSKYINFFQIS